jgi:hypothetical protein
VLTELRRRAGRAWFVIGDADAARRAAALDLSFALEGEELVREMNAEDPALEKIFARFAEHAPAMLDQAAGRLPVPWEATLELVLERAHGLDWFLPGSVAAVLRGADVQPRDVDLVTTHDGAHELARRFAAELVHPLAHSDSWIAARFGRAFAGARIEWIGGIRPDAEEDGPKEFSAATAERLEEVVWRGHRLRVPPLDVMIAVARARGLADRAAALETLR